MRSMPGVAGRKVSSSFRRRHGVQEQPSNLAARAQRILGSKCFRSRVQPNRKGNKASRSVRKCPWSMPFRGQFKTRETSKREPETP